MICRGQDGVSRQSAGRKQGRIKRGQMSRLTITLGYLISSLAALQPAVALNWKTGDGFRTATLQVPAAGRTGFTALPADQTGILFTNALAEERALTNQIYLNGSGVAAGDVDGDGLCDLYFCGLDRPNALYRNLGNWKFVEVTAEAGVACADQASTGAVFADVDGDGDLDLLVDRKSTRLNSSHGYISYAVFCLKKKNK